ncbi:MAG: tetratricopeptide repeat protein, partial [Bacteroidota bacterium]
MPRTLCISVTVGFFLLACDLHNRPETDPAELFERGVDLFEDRSYQQAETSLNQALEQFEKQKNGSQAARVLGYIGQIKLTQGQYRAALDRLQSAIDHSRSANDYRAESQMNMYLGDVFLEMGEAVTASERYQGAHSYYTAFNDKKASADVELRMARAAQRAGEWERALQLYERAYNYYGSSNDPAAKAEALDGMGEIYASQGRHPEALNSFTQALTALGSSGNTVLEARLKLHAGLSQSAMGNPNAALEQLREAANALRSKRVARELESLILFRIGTIYYYSGRSADAKRYYTEASSVARAVGDKIADNYNALLIARCDESMVQTEELEKTIEPLLQSYKSIAEAFNASGHRTGEAYAWAQAGRLHGVLGNLDRAHELYSKA